MVRSLGPRRATGEVVVGRALFFSLIVVVNK
jgi:hypothetical protein